MRDVFGRLSIKPTQYRGKDGYLIYGRDPKGRQISIFTDTRSNAEYIRAKVASGREINYVDFQHTK